MSLPNSISSILLVNDLPLGARLGTPREAVTLPPDFRTGAVDPWVRARGSVSGDGLSAHLAWELDDDGVLAQARADLSGANAEVHAALETLYSAKFGAPKKARGGFSWSVNAGLPAKLTLAPLKKGATLVIELTRDAGAAKEKKVPAPSALVDFVLGPEFVGAAFGKRPPAAQELMDGARLEVHAAKSRLLGLELAFPEFTEEAAFVQRFDSLAEAITAKLGAPKKAKKKGAFELYRGCWWVLDGGGTLHLASRENPNDGNPVRHVTVRAFPGENLSMAAQEEAGLR